MPQHQDKDHPLKPGDYFEGCNYHPCLTIFVDYEEDEIEGFSLVDGHRHSCSLRSCGVVRLSLHEAIAWKFNGPKPRRYYLHPDMADDPENDICDPAADFPQKARWWQHEGADIWSDWDIDAGTYAPVKIP